MVKLRPKFWLYGIVIPALVIALDQATKLWAFKQFNAPTDTCKHNPYPGLEIDEFTPLFDLSLVCNQGVSFGLLNDHAVAGRIGLTVFAAIMCIVLLVWLNKERNTLLSLSLGLIIGGAVGNAIDRARYGAVTDFIDFKDMHFKWVFNIADSAITIGVIGLFIYMFIIEPKEKKQAGLSPDKTRGHER